MFRIIVAAAQEMPLVDDPLQVNQADREDISLFRSVFSNGALSPVMLGKLSPIAATALAGLWVPAVALSALRNWPDQIGATLFHLVTLCILVTMAQPRLAVEARTRVVVITCALFASSIVALDRNQSEMMGALVWSPAVPLLMMVYSTRTATLLSFVAHGVLFIAAQPFVLNISVNPIWVLWCFLTTLVAGFIAKAAVVLVNSVYLESKRDKEQIERLLEERRGVNQILTAELRAPITALSTLMADAENRDRVPQGVQDQIEHLNLVIDNLASNAGTERVRPVKLEPIVIRTLVHQIEKQLAASLQSFGVELSVDVSKSADIEIISDRFRLRTVINNLLRNSANETDGYHIWLNVDLPKTQSGPDKLVISIEDNGHGGGFEQAKSAIDNQMTDSSTVRSGTFGLRVARFWLEGIHGSLEVFHSPHGGLGFRILLPLDTNGAVK